MARWFGWSAVVSLIVVTLFVLVGQEPTQPAPAKSGFYTCSLVQSPKVLQVEGIGTVRLIGVQVAEGSPEFAKASELVKKLAEGKLVWVEVCPKTPKDEQGNFRAEVFYVEKGQRVSLNRRLLREKLADLAPEPNCHVNWASWQKEIQKVTQQEIRRKLRPVPRRERLIAVPPSLRAVPRMRRVVRRPLPTMTRKGVEDLAMRTIAPSVFRQSLEQAEVRLAQTAANLDMWRETRWRVDTLEQALLPVASKAILTPWRFSQLVLRGTPSPLVASEINPVLAPLGGEPMHQRLIRLGLTSRKEILGEILNWFPDTRSAILQRLRSLGAQLVGGTAVAAPTAPTGGGPAGIGMPGGEAMPFGPPGRGGMGGPGMMPSMMGGAMAPGMGGPGGPAPEMLGEEAMAGGPMGMPGGMMGMGAPGAPGMPGAPVGPQAAGGGAVSNFYRYLAIARAGMIDPEFAAICVLALQAYREQVDEQIQLAAAEYRRAKEEWAELKEIIVRELKKLATTPLKR